MQATRRELLKLAAETRFEASSLEKVMRLGELLGGIAAHPRLSPALVLKGGSALNLFFGEPTRLSVDLDFNLWVEVPFSTAYLDSIATGERPSEPLGRATQETTQETTQERILSLVREDPAFTRKGLANRIGITPSPCAGPRWRPRIEPVRIPYRLPLR